MLYIYDMNGVALLASFFRSCLCRASLAVVIVLLPLPVHGFFLT